MTTISIIGAGEVGSQVARATIASGYQVVIANSRGPETFRRGESNRVGFIVVKRADNRYALPS